MTLQEIRAMLIQRSGRYDLVLTPEAPWTDNGADFFIRSGVRYLDLRTHLPHHQKEVALEFNSGDFKLPLTGVRAVHGARLIQVDGSELFLTPLTPIEAHRRFAGPGGIAAANLGEPVFYVTKGYAPETDDAAMFMILPPVIRNGTTIYLNVDAFSASLEEDTDTNFWSVQHPDLLMLATLYRLETFYRNRQGSSDYLQAIEEHLFNLQNAAYQFDDPGTLTLGGGIT